MVTGSSLNVSTVLTRRLVYFMTCGGRFIEGQSTSPIGSALRRRGERVCGDISSLTMRVPYGAERLTERNLQYREKRGDAVSDKERNGNQTSRCLPNQRRLF